MVPALEEFQRNTAFVLFVAVVVTTSFLFLVEKLRDVLVPLIWAFFFAIPILAFAEWVEEWTIALGNRAAVALSCRTRGGSGPLDFRHVTGHNRVYLDHTEAAVELVEKLRAPALRQHPRAHQLLAPLGRCFLSRVWGQRVKITELHPCAGEPQPPAVGGLFEGRSYYAFPSTPAEELLAGSGETSGVELRLYLDRQQMYPAVVEPHDRGSPERMRGTLEIDRRSTLSWAFSMAVAFSIVGFLAWGFVVLTAESVRGLTDNFKYYRTGVEELMEDIKELVHHVAPARILDKIQEQLVEKLQVLGGDVAKATLLFLEDFMGQAFLFFLYLMFWVLEPLPINDPIAKVFRDYMTLKTLVCLLFATIMATMLKSLGCPIWSLYFFLTFLLNYIPEVGPILAGLSMLPAVGLDARHSKPERYASMMALAIGGTLAKIVTSNVIEVKLYSRFGGEFMQIHPVVLFVFFTLCWYELGTTGSFVSVPILAAVKYSLVTRALPEQYLHTLLTLIEGDMWSAHRNMLGRQVRSTGLALPEVAATAGDAVELIRRRTVR